MKRNILCFIMLLTILSLATVSCKKDEVVKPSAYLAAVPEAPTPAVNGIVPFTGTGQTINLAWTGTATDPITWQVYFGKSSQPALKAENVTTNAYSTTITSGGKYYWQVVTTDKRGVETDGPVWSFQVNSNPNVATLVTPANAATGIKTTSKLVWSCSDPQSDALTYDVYFGTAVDPPVFAKGVADTTFAPTMAYNTVYYWKVVAHDAFGGISTSNIKSFKSDIQRPDFTVFNGIANEVAASPLSTAAHNVQVQRIGSSNVIALTTPLGDNMVAAGWGTVYTGVHPIYITYDPTTYVITSTKQLWVDSFIDPVEMGPMSLQVAAGSTIDGFNKKLKIKWVVSGNGYWGADYTTGTITYTMK